MLFGTVIGAGITVPGRAWRRHHDGDGIAQHGSTKTVMANGLSMADVIQTSVSASVRGVSRVMSLPTYYLSAVGPASVVFGTVIGAAISVPGRAWR